MKNAKPSGGYAEYKTGSTTSNTEYQQVRRDIDRGDLRSAEETLNRIKSRGAEWHFLYGMLNLRKGWYNEAISNIQIAVSMEPGNVEYRNALNSILSASGGYRTNAYGMGYRSLDDELCRMLQCYCCAELICDCI